MEWGAELVQELGRAKPGDRGWKQHRILKLENAEEENMAEVECLSCTEVFMIPTATSTHKSKKVACVHASVQHRRKTKVRQTPSCAKGVFSLTGDKRFGHM